jgi:hypothetical protein|tara:strand:+ start:343 stop:543 length:201 start_codon:yes stop_codon:yes gene_type:complete
MFKYLSLLFIQINQIKPILNPIISINNHMGRKIKLNKPHNQYGKEPNSSSKSKPHNVFSCLPLVII